MDWASIIFGAFLGIAAVFGMTSLALYPLMRRSFLLWAAARTLFFAVMALAMFPIRLPDIFPMGTARTDLGEIAVALAVACSGPFLAAYIEKNLKLRGLRLFLRLQFFTGLGAAFATAFAPYWPFLDTVHDFLLLTVIATVIYALGKAIQAGSRAASFQAAAWGPLILVGIITLGYEFVTKTTLTPWPVAVLVAIVVEFVISSVGMVDGFMIIQHQRDMAVADARAARIAIATDPLTGIANRRGLALRFRDTRHGRPTGLAVIDCDNFKRINDLFGHDVGDEVLIAVAHGLVDDDVFPARQGGEEFVILLYGDDWRRRAETLRRRITISVLELVPEVPFPVTASAGLTEIGEDDTLASAIKRADQALYGAKDAGRDQMLAKALDMDRNPRILGSA